MCSRTVLSRCGPDSLHRTITISRNLTLEISIAVRCILGHRISTWTQRISPADYLHFSSVPSYKPIYILASPESSIQLGRWLRGPIKFCILMDNPIITTFSMVVLHIVAEYIWQAVVALVTRPVMLPPVFSYISIRTLLITTAASWTQNESWMRCSRSIP